MKAVLSLLAVAAFVAVFGCSSDSKRNSDAGKVPLDVKEAEAKDPTRLDSARTDQEPTWDHDKADSSSAGSP